MICSVWNCLTHRPSVCCPPSLSPLGQSNWASKTKARNAVFFSFDSFSNQVNRRKQNEFADFCRLFSQMVSLNFVDLLDVSSHPENLILSIPSILCVLYFLVFFGAFEKRVWFRREHSLHFIVRNKSSIFQMFDNSSDSHIIKTISPESLGVTGLDSICS